MRYLLGVDIGSFSSKGVLLDETGEVITVRQRKHEMRVPAAGRAEHDAIEDWWKGFTTLSRGLIEEIGIDPAEIAAVGCSGIGPCALPVTEGGEPLRPAILYGVDTRAEVEIAEMIEEFGEQNLLERTGNPLTTQSVGPKVKWLSRHEPDIFAKTGRIVGCPTFIVHRLTGRFVVDHYGASCYTPFYNLAERGWDSDMIETICPQSWMPDIAWTTDIVGTVNDAAARETGLAPGTLVIAGTIDAASEALSVGVQEPGDLMIMYGTTAFFIQVNARLVTDRRFWAAPFLFEGTWSVMGGLATGGGLTQWFRKEFTGLDDDDHAFETLMQEAAESPAGANGLITLPYFSGERTPINDPQAKGLIFGLNLMHTRGDLYRSLLEGVGHAIRHNLDTFAEVQPAERVFAVGGGVKNPVWTQSVSDIADVRQTIRKQTIGAALGSAFLAGIGAGIFSRQDINRINPEVSSVTPDSTRHDAYDKNHALFRSLYEQNRDLMRL
ncbi:FGGY-family carbohydrate kinase [uncultured Cohaesibacter sp.]|uniref:FGGY-family carbohydrate kinase n=1 Tax=uncultured Cohaesibacter sp. TaxID=1002546 RepID=UPI0029C7D20E|nr:FGGY-family carbohydrate kinase [uncultured Cohaesibacter sp.]